jgi:hypothetical protein
MDTFKLPMREIYKKYTRSELVIMAWDSRWKSYSLSQMRKKAIPKENNVDKVDYSSTNGIREVGNVYEVPKTLNNGVAIPKKFFNEEGEIDLRKVPGREAVSYVRAIGIPIVTRFT